MCQSFSACHWLESLRQKVARAALSQQISLREVETSAPTHSPLLLKSKSLGQILQRPTLRTLYFEFGQEHLVRFFFLPSLPPSPGTRLPRRFKTPDFSQPAGTPTLRSRGNRDLPGLSPFPGFLADSPPTTTLA
ncbi:unnamed protein product [Caretta caretta]